MRRKQVATVGATLAAVAVLGALTIHFFWDPDEPFKEAPDYVTAATVTDEQLAAVAESRMFFAHMSVGKNLLSGMEQLYGAHHLSMPTVVDTAAGDAPALAQGGLIVSSLIGENRHPYRKLDNFESAMRAGLSSEVEVALIKFCYIDIRWDVDVERLFTTYRETLDQLEQDYPDVRFIHATAPLTTGPYGIRDHLKILVGRDDNAAREQFNELMRASYGPEGLLDIAMIEGTSPEGTYNPELYGGYSSDGAHLNETGQALVAAEFVRIVAAPSEDP